MRENEPNTVMPLRIMRSGFPPLTTIGRLLILSKANGFMIGELCLREKGEPLLIAVGIDTSPARQPVASVFKQDACDDLAEWMPLIDTVSPADRVRAEAAEQRRNRRSDKARLT